MFANRLIAAVFPLMLFAMPATQVSVSVPQDSAPASLQGIYLTSQTVANQKGAAIIDEFAKLGGNKIIFDVQDSAGRLAYPSILPVSLELQNRKTQIPDLNALVKNLHDKNMYVVARFVLFKNSFLAARKPQWTLKRKGTASPFISRDGPVWLDPANPELKQYLTDIGWEIMAAGVDEIQFDYVRFPEGGRGGYTGYSYTGDDKNSREQTITNFVAEVASQLRAWGVKVSVDVFGIVVWDDVSWKVIGQNIKELAKYVDSIYPMPYPSHFGYGWGGHRNPADEPYFFVQETTKKFIEQTVGTGVKIKPWLQGFSMRVSRFGPNYIREQIKALQDIGLQEYAVWNAANNYQITFRALK